MPRRSSSCNPTRSNDNPPTEEDKAWTRGSSNNKNYKNDDNPSRMIHIIREAQQHSLARPGQPVRHNPFSTGPPNQQYVDTKPPRNYNFHDSGKEQNNDFHYITPKIESPNFISALDSSNRHSICDLRSFSGYNLDVSAGYLDEFGCGFDNDGYGDERRHSIAVVDDGHFFKKETTKPQYPISHFPSRPITPLDQQSLSCYPITPATAPFGYNSQATPIERRSDFEETIKPSRYRKRQGVDPSGDIFAQFKSAAKDGAGGLPSPPHTVPLKPSETHDAVSLSNSGYINLMASFDMEFTGSENGYDSSAYFSSISSDLSASMASGHSSPTVGQMSSLDTPTDKLLKIDTSIQSQFPESLKSSVSQGSLEDLWQTPLSPRPESVSEADLDASLADTGITIDDITTYISGPEASDGKWVCLFPDCNKRFGRKENIKSHVQTHLGDRQFQCIHCKKCFVRQHDLKRHSKIHTGVKPYPCPCGNSFARHDALTRHRQRGMCVGAFEGVVKKVVKRGRPRKHRPEMEERLDKATRTRQSIDMSSCSSTSGQSESSWHDSPPPSQDIAVTEYSSPFQSFENLPKDSLETLNPDILNLSPPSSPKKNSPRMYFSSEDLEGLGSRTIKPSHSKRDSIFSLNEGFYNLATTSLSPVDSHSTCGSPPALSPEITSPPSKYLNLDSPLDLLDCGNTKILADPFGLPDISEHTEDYFLNTFDFDDGLTTVEREPHLLMLDKFDDNDFINGDGIFHDASESFFENP
ncbi:MAG: Metallothionein expression activator [Trizodia sp. TS-e1964]|nr:MAG: Metallothionein expression activator [Trizodia sp. TS-e1964]